jgi:hypothetical protein
VGVGNRRFYSCLFLSIGRLTVSLVFRFLWRYVGGKLDTSGLGRMTMSRYVSLNISRLGVGA